MCGNNTAVSVYFEPFDTSLLNLIGQRSETGLGSISEQEGVEIIHGISKVGSNYLRHSWC